MMRRFARELAITSVFSVVVLAGCNKPPKYTPPKMALAPTWSGEGVFKVATPQDGVLRKDWWTLFGDQQLNDLEVKAAAANPDLQAAGEHFTQSRYLITQAHSRLLPHIGLGAATSDNKSSENRLFRSPYDPLYGTDESYGAEASWEPDIWRKIRNTTDMRKELAQADAADVALTRLSIQAELAEDYMRLRGLDVQDAVYRQSIASYKNAVNITQLRLNGDIAPRSDVTRAQNQLSSTEAQEINLRMERSLLEHAIAILINQTPTNFHIAPEDTFHLHLPSIPIGVPSTLLQRRPDIASAERHMAASNTAIGISKAAFYPDIRLGAMAGFSDDGFGLTSLANSLWSYGMSGALPLFEGGERRAELQRSYAEYRQTTDEYRSTVLNAFREVEDSLSRLRYLSGEEQKRQEATTAALQTQKMQMQLYTGDLTNYLDVVVAQIAALDARLSAVEVQTARFEGAVGMVRSLGGGWDTAEIPAQDHLAPMKALQYKNLGHPAP
ncbi:MAG: efflux transporter outer membrane subunit [Edaphobacter sp.]|uniref:efflux transporter outer membrane subunit n=1 Tax=Edaphobacter sp. TaxID=1934404 RepID=UPI002382A6A8|nr:efflux transporter outer membrane subunit [Edaphobacter sp.]MDE1178196.1 efflux transporter outer membrane subunit [Edaphobacter sp.]